MSTVFRLCLLAVGSVFRLCLLDVGSVFRLCLLVGSVFRCRLRV